MQEIGNSQARPARAGIALRAAPAELSLPPQPACRERSLPLFELAHLKNARLTQLHSLEAMVEV